MTQKNGDGVGSLFAGPDFLARVCEQVPHTPVSPEDGAACAKDCVRCEAEALLAMPAVATDDGLDIRHWVRVLMDGTGGFKAWHRREVVIGKPTIYKAVEFAIRALANPRCEGAKEVLDAILAQRARTSS